MVIVKRQNMQASKHSLPWESISMADKIKCSISGISLMSLLPDRSLWRTVDKHVWWCFFSLWYWPVSASLGHSRDRQHNNWKMNKYTLHVWTYVHVARYGQYSNKINPEKKLFICNGIQYIHNIQIAYTKVWHVNMIVGTSCNMLVTEVQKPVKYACAQRVSKQQY